jgi:single-strand DNA-binding protein
LNDLNKWTGIGRLTKYPELKYLQAGTAIAMLSIAVNRKYKEQEEVSYFDIQTWSKQAEICCQYLTKGSKIAVDGRLKQERWEKDGKTNSKIIIVAEQVQFLDSKKDAPSGSMVDTGTQVKDNPFSDDDIPF